jgi:hypothetical protein
MRGTSGDECGNLLGQEYNRPAEAGVLKKPRGSDFNFNFNHNVILTASIHLVELHLHDTVHGKALHGLQYYGRGTKSAAWSQNFHKKKQYATLKKKLGTFR